MSGTGPPESGSGSGWSSLGGPLDTEALVLKAAYDDRFGPMCLDTRADLLGAIYSLAGEKGILPHLSRIMGRSRGEAQVAGFEEHLQAGIEALSRGESLPPSPPGVPVDPFDYLWEALGQAADQKARGFIADSTPAERLLAFLRDALDHPSLEFFRVPSPGAPLATAAAPLPPDPLPPPSEDAPEAPPVGATAPAASPEAAAPPPAREVGPYQILEEIGRGGMSTVFKAYHTLLKQTVAIKIIRDLPPPGPEREHSVARFLKEAELHAKLDHPNIVRLREAFEHAGELYIVMEFVEGETLSHLLAARQRLGPPEVIDLGVALAQTLSAALSQGVIHRDLKPDNILVTREGAFKLADFGIAKALRSSGTTRLTDGGYAVGTPGYMSPEQIRGEEVDHRSDIYGVGAVLYHAASGVQACWADDVETLMYKALNEEPARVSHLVEGFPDPVESVILKCLKKRPEERYQSYSELLEDLYRAKAAIEKKGGGRNLRKGMLLATAGALLLAAFAAVFLSRPAPDPKAPTASALEPAPPAPAKTATVQIPPEAAAKKVEEMIPRKEAPPAPPVAVTPPPAPEAGPKPAEAPKDPRPSPPSPPRVPSPSELFASHVPTEEEMTLIRALWTLLDEKRDAVSRREYGAAIPALETFADRPGHTAYTRPIAQAAREAHRLAPLLEERFEKTLVPGREVSLVLEGGKPMSGTLRARTSKSVTLLPLGGNADREVRREEILPESAVLKVENPERLVYRLVQGEIVPAGEDFLKIMTAPLDDALRGALLPHLAIALQILAVRAVRELDQDRREPGEKLIELCLKAGPSLPEALRYALEPAKQLSHELEAHRHLTSGRLTAVVEDFAGTRAYPRALRRLIEEAGKRLARERLAGSEIELWSFDPFESDLTERRRHIFVDHPAKAFVLSDPAARRTMSRRIEGAGKGFGVEVQFLPGVERPQGVHAWGLQLTDPSKAPSLELVGAAGGISVYETPADGKPGKRVAAYEFKPVQGFRRLTVLPAGRFVLVFDDEALAFRLARPSEGGIPDEMKLGVEGGALKVRSLRVRTSEDE